MIKLKSEDRVTVEEVKQVLRSQLTIAEDIDNFTHPKIIYTVLSIPIANWSDTGSSSEKLVFVFRWLFDQL